MDSDVIYQELKAQVVQREVEFGDPCPSESKLCKRYGVSRSVVRGALQKLKREGYLEVSQGKVSTFSKPLALAKMRPESSFGGYLEELNRRPKDKILRSPAATPLSELAVEPRFDVSDISRQLNVARNQKVVSFCRLRFADKRPVALQWVVIPHKMGEKISREDLNPGGLTRAYGQLCGIVRTHASAGYRPSAATARDARWLQVVKGDPLIEERRVSYGADPSAGKRDAPSVPYEYLLSLYTYRTELQFDWKD